MKRLKRIYIILLSAVLIIGGSGCETVNPDLSEAKVETSSINVITKDDDEVTEIVEEYLKEKYKKEFEIALTDRPSSIYNSYYLTAYDESYDSMNITITFTDEENYTISDDGLMLGIKDDLEKWFAELVDPYIECEYKVFYRNNGFTLPDDYKDCRTAEDFLKLSPTSEYYGLLFTVLLPASEYEKSYTETASEIANRMAEVGIRGQVGITVYKDESIYDKINTRKDYGHYWSMPLKVKLTGSGVQANFNVSNSRENKYGIADKEEDLNE